MNTPDMNTTSMRPRFSSKPASTTHTKIMIMMIIAVVILLIVGAVTDGTDVILISGLFPDGVALGSVGFRLDGAAAIRVP